MQTTRDFTHFYNGLDDPKRHQDTQQAKVAVDAFVTKRKERDDYLQEVDILLHALTEYNTIRDIYTYGTVDGIYLYLLNDTCDDDRVKAALNKAETLSTEIFNELQFFTVKLGTIAKERQEVFLMDERLSVFHFLLSEIFANAQYLLSEGEEKVINTLSGPAYSNWTRMVEDFFYGETVDRDGEELSVEQVMDKMRDTDKITRDRAAEITNALFVKYLPVAEKEINSILDYKHRIDDMRGYDRPDRTAFIRDSVDATSIDILSAATQQAYTTTQQFYTLKAKLLGLDRLEYHERNVPIVVDTETAYPLDSAVALVAGVFEGLKPGYGDYVQTMFEQGRVDVYPKQGKGGGAYCFTDLNKQQGQYILLNHLDKLNDVTTLAHEFGHSLNGWLSAQTHTGVNHGSGGFFIAEVASTFFEGFVFDKIMSEISDPHQKIALLMNKINAEISTIHRQIACYEFEKALHAAKREQGYLTHPEIGKLFTHHMSAYMGDAVEQSAGSQNRWLYRGHIRSFFYTYSYAAGLMLSYALQAKVKADPQYIHEIEEKYFRHSGAKRPEVIFESLGIDINQQKIRDTGLAQVQAMVDEVEALVDQHGWNV